MHIFSFNISLWWKLNAKTKLYEPGFVEKEIAINAIIGNINFVAGNHVCHTNDFMKKNRISYDVCNKTERNTFLKLLLLEALCWKICCLMVMKWKQIALSTLFCCTSLRVFNLLWLHNTNIINYFWLYDENMLYQNAMI